ncbi:MAG: stage III sporulation protein AC [Anaerotignum sp.]|nr:stage III sporulation protein AC [Clostridia bacterium]MBQ3615604.1 stage III sporulation protein AC [Anaerotignum sp.]
MDMSLLFKIAGAGILIAVTTQILQRSGRDDQASLLSLAGVIVILLLLVGKIGDLFTEIRTIFNI